MESINVLYNRENLTIDFITNTGKNLYYVDLEECRGLSQMLDYIFQISFKTWCTPEVLMQFFECIQIACRDVFDQNPQGVFCPGGQNKKVSWT